MGDESEDFLGDGDADERAKANRNCGVDEPLSQVHKMVEKRHLAARFLFDARVWVRQTAVLSSEGFS